MRTFTKKIVSVHRDESGQAFAELCISLIPLLCVMMFLIYFAGISISSIDVLLDARGNADANAANGQQALGVSMVRSWQYGHDQEDSSMAMAYFQDDKASGSSSVDDTIFLGQINNGEDIFTSNDVTSIYNSYFGTLSGGDLFLDAAKLASGSAAKTMDSVGTLDVSKTDGLITATQREQLDKTFDALMPGDGLMSRLNANEQSKWQSNQVYMPVTQ